MAVAVLIKNVNAQNQNCIVVTGKLVCSGSYVTGGDTVDFTKAIADPTFIGMVPAIESSLAGFAFDAWSAGGNIANGYFPIEGNAQNNCKLKITSAFNTELAAGAYPGAITGDTIDFQIAFFKLI